MTDLIIYLADKARTRSFYPLLRQGLNLIFITSITRYIIFHSHPSFESPALKLDLGQWVIFFIQGHFFIPSVIYLVVYIFTKGFSTGLFFWLGDLKNQKISRALLKFQTNRSALVEGINGMEEAADKFPLVGLTKEKFFHLYKLLKPKFREAKSNKTLNIIEEQKDNLNNNFAMVLRGWIAATIYFVTLDIFGVWLYVFTCITAVVLLLFFVIAYKLTDILPSIMKKAIELDEIYNSTKNSETIAQGSVKL